MNCSVPFNNLYIFIICCILRLIVLFVNSSEHERENRELRMRIHSLESQKDQWTKEVSELQVKIRLAEEVQDTNRTELVDSTYRIRACKYIIIHFNIQ